MRAMTKYFAVGIIALFVWILFMSLFSVTDIAHGQEADGTNCPSGVVGLCTPGTFESSVSTAVETVETDDTGTTTTTTTTTDTTTTTVTNPETGDLLSDQKVQSMGRNQRYGGDMSSDWGGQGPASMSSGSTCGDLGTDRCAQITGSGNFTSTHGQTGIGSTFRQTIDLSNESITRGGKVDWSLRVEKRDASDSIHFRVRKSDGTNTVLLGTQTLSAAGADPITNQLFSGGFDFGGAITNLSVEVSGRDINLAIGPLFDDVSVNVIYNVVNTIITQSITTIEQFVALEIITPEETVIAEEIFDNNTVVDTGTEIVITPVTEQEPEVVTVAEVVAEIEETIAEETPIVEEVVVNEEIEITTLDIIQTEPQTIEVKIEANNNNTANQPVQTEVTVDTNFEVPEVSIEVDLPVPPSVEVQSETQNVEVEIQTEMQNDLTSDMDNTQPTEISSTESTQEGETNTQNTEGTTESKSETEPKVASVEPKEEPKSESTSVEKPKAVEKKSASKPKTKVEKKQEAKEKAGSKIVKKMGDKKRYDNMNQVKTLVVMQVLGNTRTFFDNQKQLQDTPGFFSDKTLPDAVIPDNNYAQYFMFGGSDVAHEALISSQYNN